jgi:cellulose synthase/poly-beta-1,6-N-acetylglucosamine synthase-like glycosyltransferase
VVVPVYLPKLEGYYKEGLDILELCLESIYLTVHDKTFISVVNNGSCKEVRDYLDNLMHDGKIQEVIHTTAIGKINAIAKGLSGHYFDLVTITDADVLFTNGWQKAVYGIYETFPKAGMVGTTPNKLGERFMTENIYFDNLFSNKVQIMKTKSTNDIRLFYKSIGIKFNPKFDNMLWFISGNPKSCIIGAGHFCSTYRNECLIKFNTASVSKLKMGGQIMREYIDKYIFDLGLWRLSTIDNFTYHMGNVKEEWMEKKNEVLIKEKSLKKMKISNLKIKKNRILSGFKFYFMRKFIFLFKNK